MTSNEIVGDPSARLRVNRGLSNLQIVVKVELGKMKPVSSSKYFKREWCIACLVRPYAERLHISRGPYARPSRGAAGHPVRLRNATSYVADVQGRLVLVGFIRI